MHHLTARPYSASRRDVGGWRAAGDLDGAVRLPKASGGVFSAALDKLVVVIYRRCSRCHEVLCHPPIDKIPTGRMRRMVIIVDGKYQVDSRPRRPPTYSRQAQRENAFHADLIMTRLAADNIWLKITPLGGEPPVKR